MAAVRIQDFFASWRERSAQGVQDPKSVGSVDFSCLWNICFHCAFTPRNLRSTNRKVSVSG